MALGSFSTALGSFSTALGDFSTALGNLAAAQVPAPLHKGGAALAVGHHQDGGITLAGKAGEQCHHFIAGMFIEIARGLIGKQQRRALSEGAGNGYPLLLTAGEAVYRAR
ncbi:hypothetical protein [Shewanella khirikhana]|uniref:hypothetical protein n=1 Tax=Shewanella khirikhana TaxID=1965282 RepID=UPI003BAF8080